MPAVLFGAATHDIGKTVQPSELVSPGNRHEKAGEKLLPARGYPAEFARFARTHGEWVKPLSPTLEDLLVALADTVWKGKRDEGLEQEITSLIANGTGREQWSIWLALDDKLTEITANSDQRLQWQNRRLL